MKEKAKELLFEKQAQVAKALAHPLRVAIVDFLKNGPQCVCDIAEYIGSERSNVSRHLSVMANAGLVSCEKSGLKVMYQLRAKCVIDFLACTTDCLKQQLKTDRTMLKSL